MGRRVRYIVHKQAQRIEIMRSTTFTVRVDASAKKRLERLAKNTGRSRSFLAAEAINRLSAADRAALARAIPIVAALATEMGSQ